VVAQAIAEKGYPEFLPLFRRRKRVGGQIREVEEPMFPGYVFGRFDVNRRLPILVTPGVRAIVGSGKVPIPVEDGEIEALQVVGQSGLEARPWPFLEVGQWVRIDHGAMQDLEGILVATRKQHRLVVSVTLLERSVAVEIDEAWVTPIASRGPRV
jgi:transcription antitermination factor NusG